MTINNAITYLRQEQINLSHPVRFMEVRINKKIYRDVVVGVYNDLLILVTKSLLDQIIIKKFKIEVEDTEIITHSMKAMQFLMGEKTIVITMKKAKISLIDPIVGDFSNLIRKIDFNITGHQMKIEQINQFKLYTKKTFRYSKYIIGTMGIVLIADLAADYAMEWIREEAQNIVSESIVEESDHIAQKTSDKFFDRINPFS